MLNDLLGGPDKTIGAAADGAPAKPGSSGAEAEVWFDTIGTKMPFSFGRNLCEPSPSAKAPSSKAAQRLVEELRSVVMGVAYAAHAATTPAMYLDQPDWPAGWNGTIGKILGAIYAEPAELAKNSLDDNQNALSFLVASRVAVPYVARAATAATAKAFDARYDAALRDSELAQLAVANNLEVRTRARAGGRLLVRALRAREGSGGHASCTPSM